MNPRSLFALMLAGLLVAPMGCGRRVRQATREKQEEQEKAKPSEPAVKEIAEKPKPQPKATAAEKKVPVVPAAAKPAAQPELAPMTTAATVEGLKRTIEEERAAHAKTQSDLLVITKKYADLEREVQRLKASPKPSAETKGPAAGDDAARQRLLALARELYDEGKYEPAKKTLEILMDLGHKGGYAYYMLARSYSELGHTDRAVDYYKMACDFYEPVEPKPKYYLYALNNLGTLLREQGRYREARIVYERAQFVNPDYATAHYNLGVLYSDYLNDKRRAIEHYQRYVDLRGERSAEVLERMRKLREDLNKEENK